MFRDERYAASAGTRRSGEWSGKTLIDNSPLNWTTLLAGQPVMPDSYISAIKRREHEAGQAIARGERI